MMSEEVYMLLENYLEHLIYLEDSAFGSLDVQPPKMYNYFLKEYNTLQDLREYADSEERTARKAISKT